MTKLDLDQDFYLVICAHPTGAYFPGADITEATENHVLADLISGQYDNPLHVLRFNLDGSQTRDVSEDMAIDYWKAIRDTVSFDGMPEFIKTHFPYTDEIQANVWGADTTYKQARQTRIALSRLGLCDPITVDDQGPCYSETEALTGRELV